MIFIPHTDDKINNDKNKYLNTKPIIVNKSINTNIDLVHKCNEILLAEDNINISKK